MEDLVLALPLLVTSVMFAAIMVVRLRRLGTTTAVSPLVAAEGAERMWRYAKWSGGAVSLLIALSVTFWGVRSRSVWAPAFVGSLAIFGVWIGMAVLFRPKRLAG